MPATKEAAFSDAAIFDPLQCLPKSLWQCQWLFRLLLVLSLIEHRRNENKRGILHQGKTNAQ